MADRNLGYADCQGEVGGSAGTLMNDHAACEECSFSLESLNLQCPACGVCDTITENSFMEEELMVAVPYEEQMDLSQENSIKAKIYEHPGKENFGEKTHMDRFLSINFKGNICERIDEGLVMADSAFQNIDAILQTLQEMEDENKQAEEKVSEIIVKEFDKMFLALENRRSNLFAELKKISGFYRANIQKAMRKIVDKKNYLETRVKFAKGLKESPALSTYCDLNQLDEGRLTILRYMEEPKMLLRNLSLVLHTALQYTNKLVADLKLNLENEHHAVNDLKFRSDIRLNINSEKIIKILGMANVYSGNIAKFQLKHSGSIMMPSNTESTNLDIDSLENRNTKTDSQFDSADLLNSSAAHRDLREMSLPVFVNDVAASPHSLSSPDVIIEEIIEDEQNLTHSETDNGGHQKKNRKVYQKKMNYSSPLVQKGGLELVFLSHVINPCNFYVRRYSDRKNVILLEKALQMRSRSSLPQCPTDTLIDGEIIAVKSTEYQAWSRGKITELIPLESKYMGKSCGPTKYKIEDISHMKVFLLDHGSSEFFIVERFAGAHTMRLEDFSIKYTLTENLCKIIRKLDSSSDTKLSSVPPFALHCSLVDIAPLNSDGCWTTKATYEFLNMVNNKGVHMKVIREEDNKLFVDLKKPPTNRSISELPASLREALVFLDLARFSLPGSAAKNIITRRYTQPILPNHKTETTVIVCHMNNPSDFYIHLTDDSDYICLVNKLQEVYNNEESGLEILCPVIGQVCIAKYEDDNWYRAEVIGLPRPQKVEIKYVDFGNISVVDVRTIRELKDEFLSLPCKAICCRLAFIEPRNKAQQWSLQACEMFEAMAALKHLQCISIGILLDNKLSVELFERDRQRLNSINTMLVMEEVASFIPCAPGYSIQNTSGTEVWDPVTDVLHNPCENMMDIEATSLFKRKELDVRISHVVSPSRIYVQWLTSENYLKSLQAKMFAKYENSSPETVDWQVDMFVAVQLPVIKQWRRGQIKAIVSEKRLEVFHYDFGIQEITDVNQIRLLDESLKAYGNMCLECSLMDIQPAGGSQTWTATACDVLSYFLNGAAAKMIIEDNASHWPLPVKILRMDEEGQEVDMSDFLIRRGLALKDRRLNKTETFIEVKENSEEVGLMEVKESSTLPNEEIGSSNEVQLAHNLEPSKVVCGTKTGSTLSVSDEPMPEQNFDEPYLPPVIPDEEIFMAKVSHIEDGTIHVIQESLENDLNDLMQNIQKSFKGLGYLGPYCWKKGEGCLIKGSDTRSYRGRVLEILGGDMMKVQYVDFGYTEKIPKCHVYPTVFNSDVPRFCIPCQLHNTLPVGNSWQPDAVELLKELLMERHVKVNLMEPPTFPGGLASVYLYCANASVSAILEQYAHCVPEDCDKRSKVETASISKHIMEDIFDNNFHDLVSQLETPLLPPYALPILPPPGELFPVTVTHIQTPNEVFINLEPKDGGMEDKDDSGLICDSSEDTLESSLQTVNLNADSMLPLTDFRTGMPCLAFYDDDQLYRAKLQSISSYDPLSVLVEFVDYGSTKALETSSIFQLPATLIKYPLKAFRVKLSGFKPPVEDFELERLPYCPEWSFKALQTMIDVLQGKQLYASFIESSPEPSVFLYEKEKHLVQNLLISMGLADVD